MSVDAYSSCLTGKKVSPTRPGRASERRTRPLCTICTICSYRERHLTGYSRVVRSMYVHTVRTYCTYVSVYSTAPRLFGPKSAQTISETRLVLALLCDPAARHPPLASLSRFPLSLPPLTSSSQESVRRREKTS